MWLKLLGAHVNGYSLDPPSDPSHFDLVYDHYPSIKGDINNGSYLLEVVKEFKPEIIFHLAAQALVRPSYTDPVLTYKTNVLGTLNVLEAARKTESVQAIINVTSDKCYENKEMNYAYNETDELGGFDPYSSSKASSEILTSSYRRSFFNPGLYQHDHKTLLASARAGNVIGGGDWGAHRIIPDLVRNVHDHKKTIIRNADAIRPWQHVLEPLSGYLVLGQQLLSNKVDYAEAWNFGPIDQINKSVGDLVELARKFWDRISYESTKETEIMHEAGLLALDCTKSKQRLNWENVWDLDKTVERTILWYKQFYESGRLNTISDIQEYISDAKYKGLAWT